MVRLHRSSRCRPTLRRGEAVPHGRWLLTPRAHYDITARILSREDYHFDARRRPDSLRTWRSAGARCPITKCSSCSTSARARASTAGRRVAPLPLAKAAGRRAQRQYPRHPGRGPVRGELARLRVGQVVHLSGLLVDGKRAEGAYIHTSLTRSDEGAGACEIMLVDAVEECPLHNLGRAAARLPPLLALRSALDVVGAGCPPRCPRDCRALRCSPSVSSTGAPPGPVRSSASSLAVDPPC